MKPSIMSFVEGAQADHVGLQRFSLAMAEKLAAKRAEGRSGWNLPRVRAHAQQAAVGCTVADLKAMLAEHVEKGDPVDIANFCMMIWNRQHPNGAEPKPDA